jgi:phosphoribosyl-ATP pyrophosphohydrolase/phosphoribosyl-AMP cyclohydrolase
LTSRPTTPHRLARLLLLLLLRLQGVPMEDVLRVLRQRFGTSGVEEKAARPPKPQQ